jgi:hypothetical protein
MIGFFVNVRFWSAVDLTLNQRVWSLGGSPKLTSGWVVCNRATRVRRGLTIIVSVRFGYQTNRISRYRTFCVYSV